MTMEPQDPADQARRPAPRSVLNPPDTSPFAPGELAPEVPLLPVVGQPGTPELVHDEKQYEHACGDEGFADPPDDAPDHRRRR